MMDATAFGGAAANGAMRVPAPEMAGGEVEKLPLPQSAMLIVLGSGGCWFLLTLAARWLFF
ncbi:hypothetical protein [Geminicoccus roseus]|uniref:hypothetical protein n=1 Tax=Geminicoccus roseus TaxID=404900 RepID=UPI0012F8A60E|nr:hypothetical protein [Geminicoccus roseus]